MKMSQIYRTRAAAARVPATRLVAVAAAPCGAAFTNPAASVPWGDL